MKLVMLDCRSYRSDPVSLIIPSNDQLLQDGRLDRQGPIDMHKCPALARG